MNNEQAKQVAQKALSALESCGSEAECDGGRQWFSEVLVDEAIEVLQSFLSSTDLEKVTKKLPYKPGTPLLKIVEGGVMRDFQTSQIIEEAAVMGFQVDREFVERVRKDFNLQLEKEFQKWGVNKPSYSEKRP